MQLFSKAAPKAPTCYCSNVKHLWFTAHKSLNPDQGLQDKLSHHLLRFTTVWSSQWAGSQGNAPSQVPSTAPWRPAPGSAGPSARLAHWDASGNGTLSHAEFRPSTKEMQIGYLTAYTLRLAFSTVHRTKHIQARKQIHRQGGYCRRPSFWLALLRALCSPPRQGSLEGCQHQSSAWKYQRVPRKVVYIAWVHLW